MPRLRVRMKRTKASKPALKVSKPLHDAGRRTRRVRRAGYIWEEVL